MAYRYATWTPDLETGNAAIDSQHKQLILSANALVDAYLSGKGRQEVGTTLHFLVGYTIQHFADEEELQKKHDYPEYQTHKQAHIDFTDVVHDLTKRFSHEGFSDEFINEVYVTTTEWLFDHIRGEDLKMAAYIKSKERNIWSSVLDRALRLLNLRK